jgi:translation initiation factor 2 subunit 2
LLDLLLRSWNAKAAAHRTPTNRLAADEKLVLLLFSSDERQTFIKHPGVLWRMLSYEEMLARAKDILPDESEETSRFSVPNVKGHIEGSKTIINNWTQIADQLRRKPEHLLKYVQKELATPGEMIKASVIFGTKLPAGKINEKIKQYADEFVFCKTCGKPDTKLTKEVNVYFIVCQACGAKNSVQSRI